MDSGAFFWMIGRIFSSRDFTAAENLDMYLSTVSIFFFIQSFVVIKRFMKIHGGTGKLSFSYEKVPVRNLNFPILFERMHPDCIPFRIQG